MMEKIAPSCFNVFMIVGNCISSKNSFLATYNIDHTQQQNITNTSKQKLTTQLLKSTQ